MSFDSLLKQRIREHAESADQGAIEGARKQNAPDKCWGCIHFGMCKMKNPEDCTGYRHETTESKI